jgi:hypothetical protein
LEFHLFALFGYLHGHLHLPVHCLAEGHPGTSLHFGLSSVILSPLGSGTRARNSRAPHKRNRHFFCFSPCRLSGSFTLKPHGRQIRFLLPGNCILGILESFTCQLEHSPAIGNDFTSLITLEFDDGRRTAQRTEISYVFGHPMDKSRFARIEFGYEMVFCFFDCLFLFAKRSERLFF